MVRAFHPIITLLLLIFVAFAASGQWVQQPFPYSDTFGKVRFIDSTNGWILGQKYIYRTTDAGTTWTKGDSSDRGGTLLILRGRDTLFSAGIGFSAPWTMGLRKSVDGGIHFTVVDTQQALWNDMAFLDRGTGFVVGGVPPSYAPIIKKTTDGGTTWVSVWSGEGTSSIQGIAFPEPLHGWACISDGRLLETTNGGSSWKVRDSIKVQPFAPLRAVAFANKDVGITAGGISGNSLVARTTDGGKHWTSQVFFGCSFREACFLDSTTAWIGGASNGSPFIARSTDGGASWVKKDGGISPTGVESFTMLNSMNGWAVSRSVVYKTTNGGLTALEGSTIGEVPALVRLEQNYPNPFNPTTTIRYALASRSHVMVAVFNSLGQQVAVLQDGEREAGSHEVLFNAPGLPSGVYFYTLRVRPSDAVPGRDSKVGTEVFTETKRSLLIR